MTANSLSEFALAWMAAVLTGLAIIAFGYAVERLRPALGDQERQKILRTFA